MLMCQCANWVALEGMSLSPFFVCLLTGILSLSRRGVLFFSPGNVVLHVHVTQHDMHMWSSTTCTCRTALHVHVKQRSSTSFDRFVYDIPDEPFNGTTFSILSKQCNPFQNGRVALFLLLNAS